MNLRKAAFAGVLIAGLAGHACRAELSELVDTSFRQVQASAGHAGQKLSASSTFSGEFSLEAGEFLRTGYVNVWAGVELITQELSFGYALYDYQAEPEALVYVKYNHLFSNQLWKGCEFELGGFVEQSRAAFRGYIGARVDDFNKVPLFGSTQFQPERFCFGAGAFAQRKEGHSAAALELRSQDSAPFSAVLVLSAEHRGFGLRAELPIDSNEGLGFCVWYKSKEEAR
jgi:hypothetical protein